MTKRQFDEHVDREVQKRLKGKNGDDTITEETRVRLSLKHMGALVAGAALFWGSIVGLQLSIKNDLAQLKRHVADDWTAAHMALWAAYLQERNTGKITVPPIKDVMDSIHDNHLSP